MRFVMSNQRHDHPAPAGRPGSSFWRSPHRWQCTDDAAMVSLITTMAVSVMLLVPALLLMDQLGTSFGPSLTSTPRSLERIAFD